MKTWSHITVATTILWGVGASSGCTAILGLGDITYHDDHDDAGPRDAGAHDAGVADAGTVDDAGPCAPPTTGCVAPRPFCSAETSTCVECRTNEDCADMDPCTVDRCSLGSCTRSLGTDCTGSLTAGTTHTCALRGTRVWCWGRNTAKQVSSATDVRVLVPTAVGGLTGAVDLAAGQSHSCALLMSGDVRCWGDNFAGQLGNDTRDPSSAPNPVLTVTDAVSAGAGANHTCATNRDGEAACWGANGLAQIGNGEEPDDVLSPATVPHVSGAIGVSGGTSHTCALLDDGGVTCWGSNSTGQLGVGSFGGELPPTPVANLLDAVEVATGAFHTCARRTNGQVVCWGYNEYGQLGDNSNSSSSTPVVVEGLGDAISIAAGGVHSCAVRENGGVVCWGSNDNDQLGDGTGAQSLVPVAADISNALEIVAGTNFTCARRAADATTVEVYCWGANTSGQLGNGTMDPSPTPTPVIGL